MQLILRVQKMGDKTPMVEYLLDPEYDLGEVEDLINEGLEHQSVVVLSPKSGTKDIEFYPHHMKVISVADADIVPESS